MRRKDKKERQYARHNRKNMPTAEVILWEKLRRKQVGGVSFRRQHPIKPYIVDFACLSKKLIIEVDGDTHSDDDERQYDERRTAYLEQQGWAVIRFWNDDIYRHLDDVLETIVRHLTRGE